MREDLENRLRDSLDGDTWQITPSRDLIAQASAHVRRTRRRRRAGLGSVAGLAAALVAGVAIVKSTAPAPAAPSPNTTAPSPATNQGIVRPGDLVRVGGTVYAPSGRSPELCGALQIVDTLPAHALCHSPLVLIHFDPSQVTTPSAALAAPGILGTGTFTGIWHPGHLDVRSQTAGEPSQTDDTFTDSLRHVPCPTPPGGWKSSTGGAISPPDMAGVEDYKAAHPTEVLSVAVFHPAGGTVIVLAVTDPATAEAALAANYTGRLCIVQSRWDDSPGERGTQRSAPTRAHRPHRRSEQRRHHRLARRATSDRSVRDRTRPRRRPTAAASPTRTHPVQRIPATSTVTTTHRKPEPSRSSSGSGWSSTDRSTTGTLRCRVTLTCAPGTGGPWASSPIEPSAHHRRSHLVRIEPRVHHSHKRETPALSEPDLGH